MGKKILLPQTNFLDNFYKIVLLIVLFLAIGITAFTIVTGQVSFAFDQARDALESFSIWHDHHIKILGPTTDIPGVFHGVLWYYFLAIPYALFKAPEVAAGFTAFFLFLGIVPLWKLSQKLFSSFYISIGTVAIYALSPLFLSSTWWFSNPVMALAVTPFLLLNLWNFLTEGKRASAFWTGLFFGFLIQSEIAYGIFLVSLCFYFFLFKRKQSLVSWGFGLGGFLLGIGTFILGEIKYHGAQKGFANFLHGNASSNVLTHIVTNVFSRIVDQFSLSILPLPFFVVLAVIVVFFVCFVASVKKRKKEYLFLLIWICITFISQLFSSAFSRSNYLFFPSLSALCLLFTATLYYVIKKPRLLLVIIVAISCIDLLAARQYILTNRSPLPVQKEAILKDAKAVVDYTYTASKGQNFAIITMTNPLYINTTWAYLYSYYGYGSYHYLPFWAGKDQTGWIGAGVLPVINRDIRIRYLIVEPIYGIPDVYVAKIFYDEDKFSDVIEEKHFGKYLVQKRIYHKDKPLPKPPAILENSPILYE